MAPTPAGTYVPLVEIATEASWPAIQRISDRVWNLAELSLREVESAATHLGELEAAGFTITSRGTSGVPTAFVAEWTQGEGGPSVGFLPEYDALPELGNAAVPRREPRADGQTSGHGCGHNLLGAGLTGAALVARQVMEERSIAGTLRVYGSAAEEAEGAKVYMARDGLFDDLDACLHWHPSPLAIVMNIRLASFTMFKLEFHGAAAHAGNDPWKGRSALDALELAAHGLNLMREHLEPTARVHYVFESAGTAPNIVPEYARMWLVVRDVDRPRVVATSEWVEQIAHGAAAATQTTATVSPYFGAHDLLPNTPLAERMQTLLEQVGVPAWTDEEQDFARECQRNMGLDESGLATSVVPLQPEPALGGSSDVADVSWLTPTMGVSLPTFPNGVPLHSWPVTACAGMSIGERGMLAATKVLAAAALEVLTDGELRAAARADLERRRAGTPYRSPLPPSQLHPIDLPEWVLSDGATEAFLDAERQAAHG